MTSATPSSSSGTLYFGRYRALRQIGRGGMGRVLLARDEVLGTQVALKMVPDDVVRDTAGLTNLKREVLRGMTLSHPNIVRVHSFEQDATHGAIVMEYVDGPTLAEAKAQQPHGCFPPDKVRPWLEQLCQVLDYAHQEVKIAHRDLKPGNILLQRDGRIKVADFGISCSLAETVYRLSGRVEASGSPSYMSPQQAMGEPASPLDDIYSLGATLYDLLTGEPPSIRGDPITQALQSVPPSLAERRAELGKPVALIPPAWETLVAACLANDPGARPANGRAVLALLNSAATAAHSPRRSRLLPVTNEAAEPAPPPIRFLTPAPAADERPPTQRLSPAPRRVELPDRRPEFFSVRALVSALAGGALVAAAIVQLRHGSPAALPPVQSAAAPTPEALFRTDLQPSGALDSGPQRPHRGPAH